MEIEQLGDNLTPEEKQALVAYGRNIEHLAQALRELTPEERAEVMKLAQAWQPFFPNILLNLGVSSAYETARNAGEESEEKTTTPPSTRDEIAALLPDEFGDLSDEQVEMIEQLETDWNSAVGHIEITNLDQLPTTLRSQVEDQSNERTMLYHTEKGSKRSSLRRTFSSLYSCIRSRFDH